MKARGSMIETAMPSARCSIARRITVTISPTSLRFDPVHWKSTPEERRRVGDP